MNASSFLKQCVDEVVNESNATPSKIIKECVMEVLKESLSEGFDPLSDAGPNVPQENPYPEWNNKMRRLEETDEESEKGTVAHGRYAQQADATPFENPLEPSLTESSIKWQCPHCKNITKVLVEIKSPSDYISCPYCEHCGKNISEMALDMKIYEEVIRHFAGRKLSH